MLIGGGLLVYLSGAGMAHASTVAGWRWLYGVTALPNVLLLVLLIVVSATAPAGSDAPALKQPHSALWPWLRAHAGPVARAVTTAITAVAAAQTMGSWLPLALVRLQGLTVPNAAMIVGGLTLAGAPAGQLLGGMLIDRSAACRRHPGAINLAGLVGVVGGIALLIFAGGLATALAGVFVAEVAVGLAVSAGLFGMQAIIPAGVRGAANGLFLATTTLIGAGFGPLLVGLLSYQGIARGVGGALLATVALCAAVAALGMTGRRPMVVAR